MQDLIGKEWSEVLEPNLDKNYFRTLGLFIRSESEKYTVYPPRNDIFNAFLFTPFSKVKVVFIGLDPYIREGQAYGISFGIDDDSLKVPASLQTIYKEVEADVYEGLYLPFDYTLKTWCDQGCFMFNTALTVVEGKTGSHLKHWAEFTKAVFKTLNLKDFCIFVLLGRVAQGYKKFIDNKPGFHIIEAAHPAAESYKPNAGFLGSGIFTKINTILENNGHRQITW